jgi:hypothetical protein
MTNESYSGPKDTSLHDFAVPGADDELTVKVDPTIVTFIERFAVEPADQDDAVAKAIDYVDRSWLDDPEFIAVLVLRGRQNGGIVGYSQWQLTGDAPPSATPQGARSLAGPLAGYEVVDARGYSVEFTHQADARGKASTVSVARTPLAHFGIFSVAEEDQDELLRLAGENAPRSFAVPGLVAVNFHRAVDRRQVINLGLWTGFEQSAVLLKQPGFADKDEYFRGIADFHPDYFDVVAVRTARR